jgi:hypothetical protein
LSHTRAVAPRVYTDAERAVKRRRKPAAEGSDVEFATSSDSEHYIDTGEPVPHSTHAERVRLSGRDCKCEECKPLKTGTSKKEMKGTGKAAKAVGDSDGKARRWGAKDKATAKEVCNQRSVDMAAGCEALVAGDLRVIQLDIEARKELVAALNEGNLKVAQEQNKAKFADLLLTWVDKFVCQGLSEEEALAKAKARISAMQDM